MHVALLTQQCRQRCLIARHTMLHEQSQSEQGVHCDFAHTIAASVGVNVNVYTPD